MNDLIILDEYKEGSSWVIVYQEETDGPVMRLITDCFLNEWVEVVA